MLPKVNEIVTAADKKMKEAVNFLEEDLKTYRVGKANPSILNNVVVDYYGSATPVPQVASVTAPDAKTRTYSAEQRRADPLQHSAAYRGAQKGTHQESPDCR